MRQVGRLLATICLTEGHQQLLRYWWLVVVEDKSMQYSEKKGGEVGNYDRNWKTFEQSGGKVNLKLNFIARTLDLPFTNKAHHVEEVRLGSRYGYNKKLWNCNHYGFCFFTNSQVLRPSLMIIITATLKTVLSYWEHLWAIKVVVLLYTIHPWCGYLLHREHVINQSCFNYSTVNLTRVLWGDVIRSEGRIRCCTAAL